MMKDTVTNTRTSAEAVVDALIAEGIEYVFGITGVNRILSCFCEHG